MNQAKRRGVRADDKAGNNVAKHYGLLEAVEQDSDHPGNQHDHCQILNKADGMHGVGLLTWYPETSRNSPDELSD
ncbi:hypothetical protein D3C78_317620 [compost metagenome]